MTFFILAISFMTDAYNHPEAHTCDDGALSGRAIILTRERGREGGREAANCNLELGFAIKC